MKKHIKKAISIVIVFALIFSAVNGVAVSFAAENETASQVNTTENENWISAWSTSMVDVTIQDLGEKVEKIGVPVAYASARTAIEPTMSGNKIRLVYSNEYGVSRLKITACTIAVTDEKDTSVIDTDTITEVTFGGKKGVTIPAGERVTSDPVEFNVTAGKHITVNTFCRNVNVMKTVGLIGGDSYVTIGNATKSRDIRGILMSVKADSGTYEVIPMLAEIDVVPTEKEASTCVIFGDSTVDNEVPRYLAKRLRDEGITNISVTQAAIRGNRLLYNGVGVFGKLLGTAAVDRFEKDVLSQAGVKMVIIKIGVNDIIHPNCESKKGKAPVSSYEDMVAGYTQLIDRCHEKGIKVYLCSIASWKGYTRDLLKPQGDIQWTPKIDQIRLDLNDWITSEKCPADDYILMDGLNEKNDSFAICSTYTTDGIHYSDEGTHALSDIFYSRLFDK